MKRRLVCLCLALGGLWLLLAMLARPSSAGADTPISVISQGQTYSFAQQIRLTAEFSSTSSIAAVTLLVTVQGDLRVFNAALPVPEEQTRVAVSYAMDLQAYPIFPHSQVDFWWNVQSADGSVLETEPLSFLYVDNRYDWREVSQDRIRVYWAADDPALGHTALRMAQDGLERIQAILGEPLTQEITIYIYPSMDDRSSALRLAGRDWAAGIANLELGVILVAAGEGAVATDDLQDTLSHEVAHIAVHHSAGGPNGKVPRWLHEGLATVNEVTPDPWFAVKLEEAVESNNLFSLETLCALPRSDQSSATLIYAQSASIVRYLQNHYGNQVIRQLLAAYGDGADCNGGVERVLGITLDELHADWVSSMRDGDTVTESPTSGAGGLGLWVGLLGGGTALASMFYLFRPRARHDEVQHERSA
jgi:hypothetical protein